MLRKLLFVSFALIMSLLAQSVASQAQATRTWVSGVGDDANPCSRTAPCKTFAGAISKTAVAGEISVLDPGGFGAVTITKSISIVAVGHEGSTLSAGTNGIVINAGATGVVNLEGIQIEGAGTGLSGVKIVAAKQVAIKGMTIRGVKGSPGNGIDVQPTTPLQLLVADSYIASNINGIKIVPGAGGSVRGLITNSDIQMNDGTGIDVQGDSIVLLDQSTVSNNNIGVSSTAPGSLQSFSNNVINNNVSQNGSPTLTRPLR